MKETARYIGRLEGESVTDALGRLRAAGFEVSRIPFAESLTAEERATYCVGGDDLVVVTKVK